VNGAVIVAGGVGERFGSTDGKQLATVAGRPLVAHTLAAFESCAAVDVIVLVTHPDRVEEFEARLSGSNPAKLAAVVPGGNERQSSVAAGVAALPDDCDAVAVHDGARPLVTAETIDAAFRVLRDRADIDGVVVGHPVFDTLHEVDEGTEIVTSPDRSRFWVAQTPQVFRTPVIRAGLEAAERDGFLGTDDASLVARGGGRICFVEGPRDNIKVTVPEDLALVEWMLDARSGKGQRT
jgi:2-C-methyl-D-erythritol 4-phosphate cytidylyltransferase